MQQQLDWANGKPEQYVGLDCQAGAAAFAGQWRKAQEFSRRAIDLAGRGDTNELAARYATEQALRGVVLEDFERAKADAAQGLKMAGEPALHFHGRHSPWHFAVTPIRWRHSLTS